MNNRETISKLLGNLYTVSKFHVVKKNDNYEIDNATATEYTISTSEAKNIITTSEFIPRYEIKSSDKGGFVVKSTNTLKDSTIESMCYIPDTSYTIYTVAIYSFNRLVPIYIFGEKIDYDIDENLVYDLFLKSNDNTINNVSGNITITTGDKVQNMELKKLF